MDNSGCRGHLQLRGADGDGSGRDNCVYAPMDGTGAVCRLLRSDGEGILQRGWIEGEDRTPIGYETCHGQTERE